MRALLWKVLIWKGERWSGLANCERLCGAYEMQSLVSLSWYQCVKPHSLVFFVFPTLHLSTSVGLHRKHWRFSLESPLLCHHAGRGAASLSAAWLMKAVLLVGPPELRGMWCGSCFSRAKTKAMAFRHPCLAVLELQQKLHGHKLLAFELILACSVDTFLFGAIFFKGPRNPSQLKLTKFWHYIWSWKWEKENKQYD